MVESHILLSLKRFATLLFLCKQFDRFVTPKIKQHRSSINFAVELIKIQNTHIDTQILVILIREFLREKSFLYLLIKNKINDRIKIDRKIPFNLKQFQFGQRKT